MEQSGDFEHFRGRYVTLEQSAGVDLTCLTGGLAGAASRTVVSPLERLKIILLVCPAKSGDGVTS